MASPTCTITGSSSGGPFATTNGNNMTAGETVTVTLSSTAGVSTWALSVIGTDESTSAPTLTVSSVTKTATFTMPSTATGVALILQSQVNGGLTNGVVDTTLTTTFALFVINFAGWRVGAFGMTLEPSATTGWVGIMNQPIRATATGGPLTGTTLTLGTNPAQSDTIRMPNNVGISWRNQANNADLQALAINASNQCRIGSVSNADTNVFCGGSNNINLLPGGTGILQITPSIVLFLTPTVQYRNDQASPVISQATLSTNSATGQVLTVQAQNCSGTASIGGDLALTSGTGTSTSGSAKLQAGGTTRIQVNGTGIGFFGVTPAARQTYTTSNHTDSRTLNETGATLVQVANVVGTMIKDLQSLGLMG